MSKHAFDPNDEWTIMFGVRWIRQDVHLAALAEARREERERCRETCEMALVIDADRRHVERECDTTRAEMAERKLSEALAHESAKAHEDEVERLREAVLKAPCPRYDELHKQGLCLDCRRYIQPCWKIRALDGEGE